MIKFLAFSLALLFGMTTHACIWDARTLMEEKHRNRDLAKAILADLPKPADPKSLLAEIKTLEADRHENDPDWWNNLAGSYLRLAQPETAAKLLESVLGKFQDNYGIHANLGTAYHLLGRYADAEKEIARDLEINPEAHFGLEKYHLALLQYLVRDAKYQKRHVYVDEFTAAFLTATHGWFHYSDSAEAVAKMMAQDYTNGAAEVEADYESFSKTNHEEGKVVQLLATVATADPPPPYRGKWNLASDPAFEEGVIYMASLNPKQPACPVMLGIAAWKKHNYHLAQAAFDKAVALGSLQTELLQKKQDVLSEYIRKSYSHSLPFPPVVILIIIVTGGPAIYFSLKFVFKQIANRYRSVSK